MSTRITCRDLTSLAEEAIKLGQKYSVRKKSELFFDPIVFTLLAERHGPAKRQIRLKLLSGQKRRQRIDFRLGGSAPVVIEMACRSHGGELSPSYNRSELKKLTRQKKASTRYLLLMDPTKLRPLDKNSLLKDYKCWNPGPGQFPRLPVRVVYAKPDHSFDFLWRAKKR